MSHEQLEQMMQQADRFLDLANHTAALDVYDQILAINPEFDEAYAMMGSVYGELGNISKAMECLTKAVQLNSQNADAWLIQGLIQQKTGNKSLALTSLGNAALYASDYDVAHFSLATLLLEVNSEAAAMDSLQRTIACNPGHVEARYLLGTIFQSKGEYANALDSYYSLIKIKPDHLDALRRISAVLLEMNNLEEAEKAALHALSLYKRDPWINFNLADVRVAQGRLTHAIDLLKSIVESGSCNAGLILRYADLLEKHGDYEAVLKTLRPMLESKPPVFNAVVIFSKFAPYLNLNEQAKILIRRIQVSGGLSAQENEILLKASKWINEQI